MDFEGKVSGVAVGVEVVVVTIVRLNRLLIYVTS
jgi:hypothetical protein